MRHTDDLADDPAPGRDRDAVLDHWRRDVHRALDNGDCGAWPGLAALSATVERHLIPPGYLDEVSLRGSEPSRFAFKGAKVLFSRIEGLEGRIAGAARYPVEVQADRIARFAAQLEAWTWMAGEAERKENPYLLTTAVSRVALFSGRLLLAHNRMLYPFHKWFLRSLEQATDKPEGIVELIRAAMVQPSADGARAISEAVLGFREWPRGDVDWPNHFIHDTEQSWLRDAAAVEDL